MSRSPIDRYRAVTSSLALVSWVRTQIGRRCPLMLRRPILSPAAKRGLAYAALILGLVVQLVLLWLLGELIDLAISLMELWAELARKHLELTL